MTESSLLLRRLLEFLAFPPLSPLLIVLAGVALWRVRPRQARALVALGAVAGMGAVPPRPSDRR